MANGHGGPRKPRNPAPSSGPGALSRRTDGGPQPKRDLPNAGYGENKDFQTAQSGAAMAGRMPMPNGPQPSSGGPAPGGAPVDVTPLGAASQRPDEPVTAGAPMGAGVGPEAMGLIPQDQRLKQADLDRLKASIPYFEWMASLPGASPSTRAFVRKLKAEVM